MFWEILKASKGLPVDDPIAALWGRKIAEEWQWQIIEITGTLPMLFISDGAALTGYRIYGTAEGAGVETPNLVTDTIDNCFINASGVIAASNTANTAITPIEEGKKYTILYTRASGITGCGFFMDFPQKGDTSYNGKRFIFEESYYTFVSPINGYLASTFGLNMTPVVFEGDMPYGYKLPLTVECGDSSAEIPVYIGDSKLGEDEYVDFEEQKIYRDISGILTPTDPPAPLPVIPTFKGENSLSCGCGVGEVTVKGKLKEIAGCYVTLADAVLYQDTKARFVLTPSLCDGYTVQAYGIIYDKTGAVTNAEAAKTGLVLGGDYTVKTCDSVTGATYSLNITPIDDIRIWAVGYITFTANGVTTTFYTEPKSAKVSELPTE